MLKRSLLAAAAALLVSAPAPAPASAQVGGQTRGVIQSGPPQGADTLQHICRGADVPRGWIVTDDIRDRQMCGGENPATLNMFNVWVIRRYDTLPVGTLLDVCANTPTPAGWVLVDVFRSRDLCGHPESPFAINVKRIRRTG